MFSYYGSKSRVVDFYPKPTEDRFIEPFAGSARYSLKYFEKDVLLIDKYEVVVKIWQWLQRCSPNDINSLPRLSKGMDLRDCNLSEEEMLFLDMCAGIASTSPRYKISGFAGEQNGRKNRFKRIADQLFKIRHWKIEQGSYEDIPEQKATWFIDPPYQVGGHAYVENKIDFNSLADWCKSRNGQVIVCENTKADWLPFLPMADMRGANQKFTVEAIWTNTPTIYNNQQLKLIA